MPNPNVTSLAQDFAVAARVPDPKRYFSHDPNLARLDDGTLIFAAQTDWRPVTLEFKSLKSTAGARAIHKQSVVAGQVSVRKNRKRTNRNPTTLRQHCRGRSSLYGKRPLSVFKSRNHVRHTLDQRHSPFGLSVSPVFPCEDARIVGRTVRLQQ